MRMLAALMLIGCAGDPGTLPAGGDTQAAPVEDSGDSGRVDTGETALAAALTITPDPLALVVSAPAAPTTGTLSLHNTGTAALSIDILAVSGEGFWIDAAPETPFSLAPQAQEAVVVGFSATSEGDVTGSLAAISSELPGGIQAATLEGSSAFSTEAGCPHPGAEVLAAVDPSGVTDLVFDADCTAWVSTLVSGTDYVYRIQGGGLTSAITGYSNYNIQSLALDPLTGDLAVSHNDNSTSGVGYSDGGDIVNIATAEFNNGTLWDNTYMNRSAGSLAWDSSGCIWVPGFAGSGTLSCVETSGSSTPLITEGPHIESVALDGSERLYVAAGSTVYRVDTETGASTEHFVAAGDILDMVFDDADDLYVESSAGQIERVPADGSAPSVFATVSGQGRLAFAPDGWLVRVIPDPLDPAAYEEWPLK